MEIHFCILHLILVKHLEQFRRVLLMGIKVVPGHDLLTPMAEQFV